MSAVPNNLLNLREYEEYGRRQVPEAVARALRVSPSPLDSAFAAYRLRPRVLIDVSKICTATAVFGKKLAMPVIVKQLDVGGPKYVESLAAGAGTSGCGICVKTSDARIVSAAKDSLKLFHVATSKSVAAALSDIAAAKSAGFAAAVVAVDDAGSSVNWTQLERLVHDATLPVVVKGIVTADDTAKALAIGCGGLCVSSQGTDTDSSVAIQQLSTVVEAAGNAVPVFYDGSVLRGTDLFKALAFGAAAVFLGRPPFWGAVHSGATGVAEVLALLRAELVQALQLGGCPNVKTITRNHVDTIPCPSAMLNMAKRSFRSKL